MDKKYEAYWEQAILEEHQRLASCLSPHAQAFLHEYEALCQKYRLYLNAIEYDAVHIFPLEDRRNWGWFLRRLDEWVGDDKTEERV